jgi:hypothetical protein
MDCPSFSIVFSILHSSEEELYERQNVVSSVKLGASVPNVVALSQSNRFISFGQNTFYCMSRQENHLELHLRLDTCMHADEKA